MILAECNLGGEAENIEDWYVDTSRFAHTPRGSRWKLLIQFVLVKEESERNR